MKNIDGDKARQGRWGAQVLMVLVGGLLLAAIAWFIAEQYGEVIEEPTTQTGPGGTLQPPS